MMKWSAGIYDIHVSQKKNDIRSMCICYLKVIEGKVSATTLVDTLRAYINSSYFRYFGGHQRSRFYKL